MRRVVWLRQELCEALVSFITTQQIWFSEIKLFQLKWPFLGEVWREKFGDYAGWAQAVLFAAHLRPQKRSVKKKSGKAKAKVAWILTALEGALHCATIVRTALSYTFSNVLSCISVDFSVLIVNLLVIAGFQLKTALPMNWPSTVACV